MHLSYWHSGGEVIGVGGRRLEPEEAARLRRLHLMQARAGVQAGDRQQAEIELGLSRELRRALAARRAWARAARDRYDCIGVGSRAANSSRELTLGNGVSGVGNPRKSHSGPQPCETW